MNNNKTTINWSKFEKTLGKSVSNAEYLLARALAIHRVKNEILQYKSENALKRFKTFLREVDKASLHDDQRIAVINEFKVTDHLIKN
jgi:hypothetical protein